MSLNELTARFKLLKQAYEKRHTLAVLATSPNLRFLEFVGPGHFYSPIPDVVEIADDGAILSRAVRAIPGLDLNAAAQLRLVEDFARFFHEVPFRDVRSDDLRYYFDNSYFAYGDGFALYAMLRHYRPKRVIEVGSGFSSAAMLDVNQRFFERGIEFTFIEPHPRRLYGLLHADDERRCQIVSTPVQKVDPALFRGLNENDFLFVDSSHVVKAHSDVLHLLSSVLPSLNKGVIVHFHDILWPFEYPRIWFEGGRAWNEAYFLKAFLQFNAAFEILHFNSYLATHHADHLARCAPIMLKAPSSEVTPGNSSLWIRKHS